MLCQLSIVHRQLELVVNVVIVNEVTVSTALCVVVHILFDSANLLQVDRKVAETPQNCLQSLDINSNSINRIIQYV